MQSLKKKLSNGTEIELSIQDMYEIKEYYRIENMKDYLKENHPDWSEEKVEDIAISVIDQLDNLDNGDDENIAIEFAEKKYDEQKKNNNNEN